MYYKKVYLSLVLLIAVVVIATGTSTAQTVDEIDTVLSDTDGDGVDDHLEVTVEVTEDGGVTGVEVTGPVDSLELPSTTGGGSQAPVTNISGGTVTFGSTGYTGTYSLEGDLSGHFDGTGVDVSAWVGAIERSEANDFQRTSIAVTDGANDDNEMSSESISEDKDRARAPEGTDETEDTDNSTGVENVSSADTPSNELDETNNTSNSESSNSSNSEAPNEASPTDSSPNEETPGFTSLTVIFSLIILVTAMRINSS